MLFEKLMKKHLFLEVYCMRIFSLDNKKLGDIYYLRDFKKNFNR